MRWRSIFRKPILLLPVFVILSRTVEEAYPLSHFPMYATLDREPVWYVYLADGETGDALPMEHIVGVRPAAAKKIFRTRLRERAEDEGLKKDEYQSLSETIRAEVGMKYLSFLRERHAKLPDAKLLPKSLALMHGEITLTPGESPDEVVQMICRD